MTSFSRAKRAGLAAYYKFFFFKKKEKKRKKSTLSTKMASAWFTIFKHISKAVYSLNINGVILFLFFFFARSWMWIKFMWWTKWWCSVMLMAIAQRINPIIHPHFFFFFPVSFYTFIICPAPPHPPGRVYCEWPWGLLGCCPAARTRWITSLMPRPIPPSSPATLDPLLNRSSLFHE